MNHGNNGFFITGTDTGVGKTSISVALLTALRQRGCIVAGMKPVASGCEQTTQGLQNDDALLLMRNASLNLPYEQVNPYTYREAIAPHIAAQTSGQEIDIARITSIFAGISNQVDYVIVEGVGGWQVPLNSRETSADLAVALNLPVILVVGIRLGCLNHALLSVASIAQSGLQLAGWVANSVEPKFAAFKQNIEALQERITAPLLGIIPNLSRFESRQVEKSLNIDSLLK